MLYFCVNIFAVDKQNFHFRCKIVMNPNSSCCIFKNKLFYNKNN